MELLRGAVHETKKLRAKLPRGGLLPMRAWRRRHAGIVALVWLHVIGFAIFVSLQSDGLSWHSASEVGGVGLLAALATWRRPGRQARTALASLALISCSALLVHLSDGMIEMHFHFFVAVALIGLYEDWLPFLLALGYVLADHVVMGALAPELLFNHADAVEHPFTWTLIHATFILATCVATIVHWALSERLRDQAQLLDLALDAILVWDMSSGAIEFWNRGAEDLYGWTRAEVLGRTPQAILRTTFPRPLAEINAILLEFGRWEGELEHTCRDGSTVVVASRWAIQHGDDGKSHRVIGINSNVTQQKQAQAALAHQATHDILTDLPNRSFLGMRLQQALSAAQRSNAPVALLMLDLDRFKEVNDTLGHEWGDQLLRAVGPRLQAELRETDTLARLGGDEFAVVLPGAGARGAEIVADKLLRQLESEFDLGDARVTVGASIGIALAPDHGADAETLLRCADVAMYAAKRAGCGRQVYVAAHDQHSRERLAFLSDLRLAVERDEFVLHFQPKLHCATEELAGLEALVRWEHPQRGLIPPDQFIPLAEQYGLIGAIGKRVLELAIRQIASWTEIGVAVPLAVNLSMRELLDAELPGTISRLLSRWDVAAHLLRVEITESSLMNDPARARATLRSLCELGIKISVDDFGTGYSSLQYLQRLPLDELKIDRSFVRHMVSRDSDFTIVRSTIDLAHGLGLQVVAEGVEDARTWHQLGAAGCDQAQGYYVSKPMPLADATRWLFTQQRAEDQRAA